MLEGTMSEDQGAAQAADQPYKPQTELGKLFQRLYLAVEARDQAKAAIDATEQEHHDAWDALEGYRNSNQLDPVVPA
jgi:hypothetical protein